MKTKSRAKEIRSFLVHLRWPYQLFVLPGGFLLGGLFVRHLDLWSFVIQFLNVHLLLNGGVTAYNSYFDRDRGPIGGLERPPRLAPWTLPASIAVQLVGLAIASLEGPIFVALYLSTMLLSVLYSSPDPRWKGHPILSLISVGIGTGTNTFLLGYLAAGARGLSLRIVLASIGVALILLSLYPLSQVFQIESDRRRGDRTFAAAFGLLGVRRFFSAAYPLGLSITAISLEHVRSPFGLMLAAVGTLGGLKLARDMRELVGNVSEYRKVMRMKLVASLGFSSFLAACLFVSTR